MDTLVCDRLFGLVLVRRNAGKRRDHAYKAVLNVVEFYLAFGFVVFVVLLQIAVDLIDKGISYRLVGCAAVLKPA